MIRTTRCFALLLLAALLLPSTGFAQRSTDYHLGIGDKVKVVVFGRPDLTDEFEITPSGKITIGLIGEMDVAGRTISQLQHEIRTRLENNHMADPKVSVLMVAYKPQHIRR